MNKLTRRSLTLSALAALTTGCVKNQALTRQLAESELTRPPTPSRRPIAASLVDFGKLAYVYTALDDRDVTIEIDFLANDSGIQKELPSDLGLYARKALSDIGAPVRTSRTLPSSVLLPGSAGAAIPFEQRERPRPPYTYRLVGSLQRASERLVMGWELGGSGLTNGTPKIDAQFTQDQKRTLSVISVIVGLDQPDGLAVPGATAQYQVLVEKNEKNRALSIYVAGSGLGGGAKLVATQDVGEALYDALAAGVIHVLGNALMVPYYRTSTVFSVDHALERRQQVEFARLTQIELEQCIKRFLFASGFPVDLSGPELTVQDRALLAVEMQHKLLNASRREDLLEYAFHLWSKLDYTQAVARIERRLTETAQRERERVEQAEREKAAAEAQNAKAPAPPANFGWPPSEDVVTVDLTRIKEPGLRAKILDLARKCSGCEELRVDDARAMAGLRISKHPSAIQAALRNSPWRLECLWADASQRGLVLIPLW